MKLQRLFFVLLTAALVIPTLSFAQGGPPRSSPGSIPNTPDDTGTTAIPFDGLTTILLAAGAGYAIKKGRAATKRKEENTVK